MILKKLIIKNFRSYYGENEFVFSKGLTLIIGDNGDGKITFFEALEWLFDTVTDDKAETNVSEKRKVELYAGESDEVCVSLSFEHDVEMELVKSFKFKKKEDGTINTADFVFRGYENSGSERLSRNGRQLLESCFDSVIRKYCLFKGESELNVFDNATALKTLVDTFSNIRQFEEYVTLTEKFENDSAAVVTREMKNDKKQEQKVKDLDSRKKRVGEDISEVKRDMAVQEKAISDYSTSLQQLEQNEDAYEAYQDIKNRIQSKENERNRQKALSSIDYNAQLLDEYWILRSFPAILNDFQSKASALSIEKRKQDRDETERRAKEEGAREVVRDIQKLVNGAVPLPWNLPDEQVMREMLDAEVCKVCGHPAPKGSKEYKFMENKLEEYLRHVQASTKQVDEKKKNKPYFPHNHIEELNKLSNQLSGWNQKEITGLKVVISERLDFIQARKRDLERIMNDLKEAEDERLRLLIQKPGLSEAMLEKGLKDFRGMSERKKDAEIKLAELKGTLKDLENDKKEIEEEFAKIEPSNGMVKLYQKVHNALKIIKDSFAVAKERNINEFLEMLQNEANKYFERLNENDFRGEVRIKPSRINDSAYIQLYSSNGTQITKPGGAQQTTMYMSILFAISNITTLKREQDYPLIFDAPTSSFGDFKEDVFYNIIDGIEKQCIIVTKDLLEVDKITKQKRLNQEKLDRMTCTVYQISKAPGFNPLDLSTIQTIVTPIK